MPFRIKDLMISVVPDAGIRATVLATTVADGDCGASGCGTTDCVGTSCGASGCGTTDCVGTSCGASGCGTTDCVGTSCGASGCGTTDCVGTSCGASGCGTTDCVGTSCGASGCGTTDCVGTSCGASGCGTTDSAGCFGSMVENTLDLIDHGEVTKLQESLQQLLQQVRLREVQVSHQRALASGVGDELPRTPAELDLLESRLREALAEVAEHRARLQEG